MVNIFTPSGRIGRLERFAYGIGVCLLEYFIDINIPSQTGLMFIILSIVTTYIFLMLDIKRFHDIGWDGSFLVMWYLLHILIIYLFYKNLWLNKFTFTLDFDNHPQQAAVRTHALMGFTWILLLANVVLNCILLFKKGNDGPNEYGPNPLKTDSNYQHHSYQHIYPSFSDNNIINLSKDRMIYDSTEGFDENDKVIIQRGDSEIIVTNRRQKKKRVLN